MDTKTMEACLRGITAEARFTHPIEIWYNADQAQESPCQPMLRNECCTGYWLAGRILKEPSILSQNNKPK